MATHIEFLDIYDFRGIENINISQLRDVNIIAGDNNSGKTSFMEALCLLRKPGDFYSVLKVARMRDYVSFNSPSLYDNFIGLFPKDRLFIGIHAEGKIGKTHLEISGDEHNELLNIEVLSPYQHKKYLNNKNPDMLQDIPVFYGEMSGCNKFGSFKENIVFNQYDRPIDFMYSRKNLSENINIVYLSPLSHMQGNTFNRIIRNRNYKKICLSFLQLFDNDIIDLLYLKDEKSVRAVEYLEHKRLGIMPLSTYGDGIKKVLSLVNGMAAAANGILLIDEIETSINYRYYKDVFNFIVMASK